MSSVSVHDFIVFTDTFLIWMIWIFPFLESPLYYELDTKILDTVYFVMLPQKSG